ncbi:hypothetical protein [Caulobacter sp. BK020]|uniref:hypothetical protein n=1 Tax=Caulobacter sp. BK020 TaxID=2512117 RepID=UPI001048F21A|nr:hypothetical protein [Caulobacter sp. BK020]TCS14995.1 hypothetical protein EV278_106183 [Caulobacter sp. BK020]
MIRRRDLLTALVALAATPVLARGEAPAGLAELDRAAIARIGEAWLARRPELTLRKLEARLFPGGRGEAALPRLRDQAAADFRRGAVFSYRGWRLSDTEGALLALLFLESGSASAHARVKG